MADNYFFDPVNPDANITIYIGGLAISNYNKRRKVWETVFLRHVKDHFLKIDVRKLINGKEEEVITISDIKPDEKISIEAGDSENGVPDLRAPGFNYQTFADKRDLGWCIDFASDRMHGRKKIKLKKHKPVTCLSIKNSTFYAARHAEGKYEIKGISSYVGHWIGADIQGVWDALKIKFAVDLQKNLDLPLGRNIKYQVVFNNACDDTDNQCLATNDFKYYYDLVAEDAIEVKPPLKLMSNIDKGSRKATRKVFGNVLGKLVACECTVCSQIDENSLFDLA
ncbi:MAG: hypothetical protein WKF90_14530 [Pyrinomonadaceae bacterium]